MKMLYAMGVEFEEGDDVLSLYQETLMKRGKHNFQQHAANSDMLEEMGIEVPDGGNVLSIYQKELMPWECILGRCTPGLSSLRWV